MDSDICHTDVDESQHLFVPAKDTQQQALEGAIAMGGGVPAILEHDPDDAVDHAVPAIARSLGWERELYESRRFTRNCARAGNHLSCLGLRVRDLTNSIPVAGASRLHDQGWSVAANVSRVHHRGFLSGAHGVE